MVDEIESKPEKNKSKKRIGKFGSASEFVTLGEDFLSGGRFKSSR